MERKMEYLEAKVEMRAPAPAHGYEQDYDEEEESYEEDTTGSGPAGRGQAESTAWLFQTEWSMRPRLTNCITISSKSR